MKSTFQNSPAPRRTENQERVPAQREVSGSPPMRRVVASETPAHTDSNSNSRPPDGQEDELFVQDRHLVQQAARLVFCVYHGIEIQKIEYTKGDVRVVFASDFVGRGRRKMEEFIQMLMSGAVTAQRVFSDEQINDRKSTAEAGQAFQLATGQSAEFSAEFQTLIDKCRRRVNAHFADPKLRATISMITRILTRCKTEFTGTPLTELISLTRARLAQ